MLCNDCGYRNREGAKKCDNCGGRPVVRISWEVEEAARKSDEKYKIHWGRRRSGGCVMAVYYLVFDLICELFG